MNLHRLIMTFASVCWVSADHPCNSTDYARAYVALFKQLEQSNNNSLTKNMRPVDPYDGYTSVFIDLDVTTITNVNENAQSITTQVQVDTQWMNNNIQWAPYTNCNIERITTLKDWFWAPDIAILESIKTEFAGKESPYVNIGYWGYTQKTEILTLTTACSMELYKFPFDTQICNLTFKSLMYTEKNELQVYGYLKNPKNTGPQSNQSFQIPGEWQLENLTDSHFQGGNVFQMTIKRKPLVYVINLIFPVFCFLVLDLASFFINASQGDKLSFKVTLLLSISVLLQVLNDRLTATNNGIPLIGVYCGVVFTLIGFSILETILVNVLKARGEKAKSVTPANNRAAVSGPGMAMALKSAMASCEGDVWITVSVKTVRNSSRVIVPQEMVPLSCSSTTYRKRFLAQRFPVKSGLCLLSQTTTTQYEGKSAVASLACSPFTILPKALHDFNFERFTCIMNMQNHLRCSWSTTNLPENAEYSAEIRIQNSHQILSCFQIVEKQAVECHGHVMHEEHEIMLKVNISLPTLSYRIGKNFDTVDIVKLNPPENITISNDLTKIEIKWTHSEGNGFSQNPLCYKYELKINDEVRTLNMFTYEGILSTNAKLCNGVFSLKVVTLSDGHSSYIKQDIDVTRTYAIQVRVKQSMACSNNPIHWSDWSSVLEVGPFENKYSVNPWVISVIAFVLPMLLLAILLLCKCQRLPKKLFPPIPGPSVNVKNLLDKDNYIQDMSSRCVYQNTEVVHTVEERNG
ncbi:5-hydroxytryptamine receptor 3A [Triplophysa tibetana]|uniref:5-hydroxytryptamine receptor 3A n=1 Tax=Triplophysa tibetana TaxID=1572043 RepID=A0A5A9PLX9_9TELE|nr:5-hydroxytryptamine receptor 3A [Triplophysa tibetana]